MRTASMMVAVAVTLAGCAGTDAHRAMLAQDNALSIRRSEAPGKDYVVSLRNLVDFSYNSDDPEVRRKTAVAHAREQCPDARVVGEHQIRTGTYLLGWTSITYELDIKCGPDDPAPEKGKARRR